MQAYQQEFIEYAVQQKIIRFGEFTLKSGRSSPYFFNSGLFNSGASLGRLGKYYAAAVINSGLEFDMLFGPAYKGIPLVCTTAIALSIGYGNDIPYCFDRKESKDHGEGGMTIGAALQGRVLIVDDVISAGTSVNHSIGIINACAAVTAGVVVGLDRQERGQGGNSAIQEVEQRHGIKVISIVNLDNLVTFLERKPGMSPELDRIMNYRERYGVKP
jgi:orotate phosphoribosyltransferase